MSAVIKTATPFALESVLFTALEVSGADPKKVTNTVLQGISQRNQIELGDILTNRKDYNGRQLFRQQGERWVLLHDSDELGANIVSQLADRRYTGVKQFLAQLSLAYDIAYQQLLEQLAEQERAILEEERKNRVEAIRQQSIAKAKSQGYSVKESRTAKGQIQLVLTRTV
ncbi:hypothetical protein [Oceanisphaera sp. W20_SRM_FM3]|uniref:hypothetical protein n=1 Tax=Oceanisphaera sp. W20_SRM_FM3 TaxID=3240267 RepID=UPI003F9BAB44